MRHGGSCRNGQVAALPTACSFRRSDELCWLAGGLFEEVPLTRCRAPSMGQ
jgi:hypothetical protein